MCYFIARSDTRRKRAISSDATLERRGYILDAMFLMLKHCKGEDIQTLIQMIRNTAQPEELIRCIKANLQSLQDQGLVDIRQIDDHDLISVAPSILLKGWMREDQRPSDGSMKNSSPGVESVSTEPDGSCLQDEISTNIGFDHGATIFPDNTRGGVQEHVPTYDNPYDFFEALGIDDDDHSSCYLPPTTVARSVTGTSQTSSVTTTPLDTHHTFMTIDLPVRPPETALDQSTFAFIEYAHRLLSTGRTLAELNDHGIPSCELLFRERTTRDRITIPNWACEVRTRHIDTRHPHLHDTSVHESPAISSNN